MVSLESRGPLTRHRRSGCPANQDQQLVEQPIRAGDREPNGLGESTLALAICQRLHCNRNTSQPSLTS
jgi:hypothetical protein